MKKQEKKEKKILRVTKPQIRYETLYPGYRQYADDSHYDWESRVNHSKYFKINY